MKGEDPDETTRLQADYRDARAFMLSRKWCVGLGEVYFGLGLGGVASVFVVEIDPQPTGVDRWLWVIVGDIPPAYLVLDECNTPVEALETYISLMREWVDLARIGQVSEEVIPVNIAAIPANAEMLEVRLNALAQNILPWLQQGSPIP